MPLVTPVTWRSRGSISRALADVCLARRRDGGLVTDKRRTRSSGNSPGGRDARRPVRGEGQRRTDRSNAGSADDRRSRGPASKPSPEVSERDRQPRIVKGKAAGGKPERTILGLSTGRAVILAVVVCALALTLAVPLRTYFTQRADAAQIAAQRVELEEDLQELREKKAQQEDPAYITAEARDRLRLVRPGEIPFQVQLPGAYEADQARRAKPKPEGGPWYKDLFDQVSNPLPEPAPAPAPVPAPAPAPLPPPPADRPIG